MCVNVCVREGVYVRVCVSRRSPLVLVYCYCCCERRWSKSHGEHNIDVNNKRLDVSPYSLLLLLLFLFVLALLFVYKVNNSIFAVVS